MRVAATRRITIDERKKVGPRRRRLPHIGEMHGDKSVFGVSEAETFLDRVPSQAAPARPARRQARRLRRANGLKAAVFKAMQASWRRRRVHFMRNAGVVGIAVDALPPAMHSTRRRPRMTLGALLARRVDFHGLWRLIKITGIEIFRDRDRLPELRQRTLAGAFRLIVIAFEQCVIELVGRRGPVELERLVVSSGVSAAPWLAERLNVTAIRTAKAARTMMREVLLFD